MIALYSHLLKEKSVRDPSKDYLLIVTLTENRAKKGGEGSKGGLFQGQGGDDSKSSQAKALKNIDRRFISITSRFEKQLKEINERLEQITEIQKREAASRQKRQI